MVYTVTLNPAIDYVMQVESIRFDDINRSQSEKFYYGGKGINVSSVLTRLGVPNKALGFAAGITGTQLEKLMRDDNIDSDFIFLDSGNTRVNVKIEGGAELAFNAAGTQISDADAERIIAKLREAKEGDFVVLAGSVPKNAPADIYERILSELDGRGVHFVVDAEDGLLLSTLKFEPFLIKPNHLELGDIFGVEIESDDEAVSFARELQNRGAKNVIVSMAENGALLVDETGEVHKTENAEGTFVNSVGCGDSMVAGFIAGYIKSRDYSYSLRLATACANATAFSSKLATADDINKLMY